MNAAPLAGSRVLVTRAAEQAPALCKAITDRGGEAIAFPALEIVPIEDLSTVAAALGPSASIDCAVFVSPNAVRYGLRLFPRDAAPIFAAIGPSTAAALEAGGAQVTIRPRTGFTSEALLAEPAFAAPHGKRIALVRGEGGRELLGVTLRARGAIVIDAPVYVRRCPDRDAASLVRTWREAGIDAVMVGSVETLENLRRLLGDDGNSLLNKCLLVTASTRVVKQAASLGLNREPLLAPAPDNDALVDALATWMRRQGGAGRHNE